MAEKVYAVAGMTCGHCVGSVSTEVGKVPGIAGVEVNLASGRVTVTGEGFADEQVAGAVAEAGYTLIEG